MDEGPQFRHKRLKITGEIAEILTPRRRRKINAGKPPEQTLGPAYGRSPAFRAFLARVVSAG